MKKYCLHALVCLLIAFTACKKDGDKISQTTISGKWSVVSDSTFTGVGYSSHAVNYMGQAGDYFDFRADGNVYTKEGPVLDTLSYHLVSGNEIVIASFGIVGNGVPEVSHITAFNSHTLTIQAAVVITPGGQFGRKIYLKR